MEEHKDIIVDTAKASVPIGAGVVIQWLHLHDQQITELTHFFGLVSVLVGLCWYVYRFAQDVKKNNKEGKT